MRDVAEERGQDLDKQTPQPFEDKAVVVAGAGEDGVDLVAVAAFEEVAPQPAIALEMSDHGLDGGAPPELLLDRRRDAAFLA